MIGGSYEICSKCHEKIKLKGIPAQKILEDLYEFFSLLEEPVPFLCTEDLTILEYLEKNQYLITTEYPDYDQSQDVVLAIPLGCHLKNDSWFFCYDVEGHE